MGDSDIEVVAETRGKSKLGPEWNRLVSYLVQFMPETKYEKKKKSGEEYVKLWTKPPHAYTYPYLKNKIFNNIKRLKTAKKKDINLENELHRKLQRVKQPGQSATVLIQRTFEFFQQEYVRESPEYHPEVSTEEARAGPSGHQQQQPEPRQQVTAGQPPLPPGPAPPSPPPPQPAAGYHQQYYQTGETSHMPAYHTGVVAQAPYHAGPSTSYGVPPPPPPPFEPPPPVNYAQAAGAYGGYSTAPTANVFDQSPMSVGQFSTPPPPLPYQEGSSSGHADPRRSRNRSPSSGYSGGRGQLNAKSEEIQFKTWLHENLRDRSNIEDVANDIMDALYRDDLSMLMLVELYVVHSGQHRRGDKDFEKLLTPTTNAHGDHVSSKHRLGFKPVAQLLASFCKDCYERRPEYYEEVTREDSNIQQRYDFLWRRIDSRETSVDGRRRSNSDSRRGSEYSSEGSFPDEPAMTPPSDPRLQQLQAYLKSELSRIHPKTFSEHLMTVISTTIVRRAFPGGFDDLERAYLRSSLHNDRQNAFYSCLNKRYQIRDRDYLRHSPEEWRGFTVLQVLTAVEKFFDKESENSTRETLRRSRSPPQPSHHRSSGSNSSRYPSPSPSRRAVFRDRSPRSGDRMRSPRSAAHRSSRDRSVQRSPAASSGGSQRPGGHSSSRRSSFGEGGGGTASSGGSQWSPRSNRRTSPRTPSSSSHRSPRAGPSRLYDQQSPSFGGQSSSSRRSSFGEGSRGARDIVLRSHNNYQNSDYLALEHHFTRMILKMPQFAEMSVNEAQNLAFSMVSSLETAGVSCERINNLSMERILHYLRTKVAPPVWKGLDFEFLARESKAYFEGNPARGSGGRGGGGGGDRRDHGADQRGHGRDQRGHGGDEGGEHRRDHRGHDRDRATNGRDYRGGHGGGRDEGAPSRDYADGRGQPRIKREREDEQRGPSNKRPRPADRREDMDEERASQGHQRDASRGPFNRGPAGANQGSASASERSLASLGVDRQPKKEPEDQLGPGLSAFQQSLLKEAENQQQDGESEHQDGANQPQTERSNQQQQEGAATQQQKPLADRLIGISQSEDTGGRALGALGNASEMPIDSQRMLMWKAMYFSEELGPFLHALKNYAFELKAKYKNMDMVPTINTLVEMITAVIGKSQAGQQQNQDDGQENISETLGEIKEQLMDDPSEEHVERIAIRHFGRPLPDPEPKKPRAEKPNNKNPRFQKNRRDEEEEDQDPRPEILRRQLYRKLLVRFCTYIISKEAFDKDYKVAEPGIKKVQEEYDISAVYGIIKKFQERYKEQLQGRTIGRILSGDSLLNKLHLHLYYHPHIRSVFTNKTERGHDRSISNVVNELVIFISEKLDMKKVMEKIKALRSSNSGASFSLRETITKKAGAILRQSSWPSSCENVHGLLVSVIVNFVHHEANKVTVSSSVKALKMNVDKSNGLADLQRYLFHCIIEECRKMSKDGDIKNFKFPDDIDVARVSEGVREIVDYLIESGFRLYNSLFDYWVGNCADQLKKVVKSKQNSHPIAVHDNVLTRLVYNFIDMKVKNQEEITLPKTVIHRHLLKQMVASMISNHKVLRPESQNKVKVTLDIPKEQMEKITPLDPDDVDDMMTEIKPDTDFNANLIALPCTMTVSQPVIVPVRSRKDFFVSVSGLPNLKEVADPDDDIAVAEEETETPAAEPIKLSIEPKVNECKNKGVSMPPNQVVTLKPDHGGFVLIHVKNFSDNKVATLPRGFVIATARIQNAIDNPVGTPNGETDPTEVGTSSSSSTATPMTAVDRVLPAVPKDANFSPSYILQFLKIHFTQRGTEAIQELDKTIVFGENNEIQFLKYRRTNFSIKGSSYICGMQDFYTVDAVVHFILQMLENEECKANRASTARKEDRNKVPMSAYEAYLSDTILLGKQIVRIEDAEILYQYVLSLSDKRGDEDGTDTGSFIKQIDPTFDTQRELQLRAMVDRARGLDTKIKDSCKTENSKIKRCLEKYTQREYVESEDEDDVDVQGNLEAKKEEAMETSNGDAEMLEDAVIVPGRAYDALLKKDRKLNKENPEWETLQELSKHLEDEWLMPRHQAVQSITLLMELLSEMGITLNKIRQDLFSLPKHKQLYKDTMKEKIAEHFKTTRQIELEKNTEIIAKYTMTNLAELATPKTQKQLDSICTFIGKFENEVPDLKVNDVISKLKDYFKALTVTKNTVAGRQQKQEANNKLSPLIKDTMNKISKMGSFKPAVVEGNFYLYVGSAENHLKPKSITQPPPNVNVDRTTISSFLTQLQDGREVPISMHSRILSPEEQKLHKDEKEFLSVLFGIEANKVILRKEYFNLNTSSETVQFMYRDDSPPSKWTDYVKNNEFFVVPILRPIEDNPALAFPLNFGELKDLDIPVDPIELVKDTFVNLVDTFKIKFRDHQTWIKHVLKTERENEHVREYIKELKKRAEKEDAATRLDCTLPEFIAVGTSRETEELETPEPGPSAAEAGPVCDITEYQDIYSAMVKHLTTNLELDAETAQDIANENFCKLSIKVTYNETLSFFQETLKQKAQEETVNLAKDVTEALEAFLKGEGIGRLPYHEDTLKVIVEHFFAHFRVKRPINLNLSKPLPAVAKPQAAQADDILVEAEDEVPLVMPENDKASETPHDGPSDTRDSDASWWLDMLDDEEEKEEFPTNSVRDKKSKDVWMESDDENPQSTSNENNQVVDMEVDDDKEDDEGAEVPSVDADFETLRKHYSKMINQNPWSRNDRSIRTTGHQFKICWIIALEKYANLEKLYIENMDQSDQKIREIFRRKLVANKINAVMPREVSLEHLISWTLSFYMRHKSLKPKFLQAVATEKEALLKSDAQNPSPSEMTGWKELELYLQEVLVLIYERKLIEAIKIAENCVKAYKIAGLNYSDLESLFSAAVMISACRKDLLSRLQHFLESISNLLPEKVDCEKLITYTAIYFRARTKLSEMLTSVEGQEDKANEAGEVEKSFDQVVQIVTQKIAENLKVHKPIGEVMIKSRVKIDPNEDMNTCRDCEVVFRQLPVAINTPLKIKGDMLTLTHPLLTMEEMSIEWDGMEQELDFKTQGEKSTILGSNSKPTSVASVYIDEKAVSPDVVSSQCSASAKLLASRGIGFGPMLCLAEDVIKGTTGPQQSLRKTARIALQHAFSKVFIKEDSKHLYHFSAFIGEALKYCCKVKGAEAYISKYKTGGISIKTEPTEELVLDDMEEGESFSDDEDAVVGNSNTDSQAKPPAGLSFFDTDYAIEDILAPSVKQIVEVDLWDLIRRYASGLDAEKIKGDTIVLGNYCLPADLPITFETQDNLAPDDDENEKQVIYRLDTIILFYKYIRSNHSLYIKKVSKYHQGIGCVHAMHKSTVKGVLEDDCSEHRVEAEVMGKFAYLQKLYKRFYDLTGPTREADSVDVPLTPVLAEFQPLFAAMYKKLATMAFDCQAKALEMAQVSSTEMILVWFTIGIPYSDLLGFTKRLAAIPDIKTRNMMKAKLCKQLRKKLLANKDVLPPGLDLAAFIKNTLTCMEEANAVEARGSSSEN